MSTMNLADADEKMMRRKDAKVHQAIVEVTAAEGKIVYCTSIFFGLNVIEFLVDLVNWFAFTANDRKKTRVMRVIVKETVIKVAKVGKRIMTTKTKTKMTMTMMMMTTLSTNTNCSTMTMKSIRLTEHHPIKGKVLTRPRDVADDPDPNQDQGTSKKYANHFQCS